MLDERHAFVAFRSTPFALVSRLRPDADDVEELLAEVRARTRAHGKTRAHWWVSDRSTPADLEQRLLALGLRPHPSDYDNAALVLTEPPPAAPAEIEVVRATELDVYRDARELQWEAFAKPQAEREAERALLVDDLAEELEAQTSAVFLARIEGQPAGAARSVYSPYGVLLAGGATAEWARGRGAYRALVRARWDDAVARGTPALVVGAGSMSRPILLRLGFREVGRTRRLVDELT